MYGEQPHLGQMTAHVEPHTDPKGPRLKAYLRNLGQIQAGECLLGKPPVAAQKMWSLIIRVLSIHEGNQEKIET